MSTNRPKLRPDPISMRLPEELKAALTEAAIKSGRSLNAEIRFRLEQSLGVGPAASFERGKRAPVTATIRDEDSSGSEYVDREIKALADAVGDEIAELKQKLSDLDKKIGSK